LKPPLCESFRSPRRAIKVLTTTIKAKRRSSWLPTRRHWQADSA
jgi:hypothetical protein